MTSDVDVSGERLDPDETAAFIGLSRSTLAQRRFYHKEPPYLKMGGKIWYLKSDLIAYLQRSRVEPGAVPTKLRPAIPVKKSRTTKRSSKKR
jgi:hypothetical protein